MSTTRLTNILLLAFALMAAPVQSASITLKWIAPGDDNNTGQAFFYDVRCSTVPITEGNWDACAPVFGLEPWPKVAGSLEEMEVNYLQDRTLYYFAIKSVDDAGNWSPMSRVIAYSTCESGCIGTRGNVSADLDEDIDISDLVFLIDYLFGNGPAPPCYEEANINGDSAPTIDMSDVLFLVEFLFNTNAPSPPACP